MKPIKEELLGLEATINSYTAALIRMNERKAELEAEVGPWRECQWKDAALAWADFKRVKCESDGGVYTYDWNVTNFKGMIEISDGYGVSPLEIKEGKWFIFNAKGVK